MYITLAMVISVDGKSTKWNLPDVEVWSSKEDQNHLVELKKQFDLIIMGRKTYQVIKRHLDLSQNKLRIILTNSPKNFKKETVPGKVEFTDEKVKDLIERLENQGYKKALLLAGQGLNQLFFEQKLVDELVLTIEPKIFGKGNGIVSDAKLDIDLKLLSVEKLNEKGTLLLKYKVLK